MLLAAHVHDGNNGIGVVLAGFLAYAGEDIVIIGSDANHRCTYLRAEECFVAFAQTVQLFVEFCLCVVLVDVNQVFLEELQTMVVTAQLTRVDHRHTGNDVTESLEEGHCISHSLLLRAVPRVLVVIGDEVHADSLGTDGSVGFGEIRPEVLHTFLTLRYIVHNMMKRPTVVHVECGFGQFLRFVFVLGEGEHMRVGLTEVTHCPVPEISRHLTGYVAAETVNAD